ncbi:fanconi-associated nuclease 1 [Rhinoraja longicauda]
MPPPKRPRVAGTSPTRAPPPRPDPDPAPALVPRRPNKLSRRHRGGREPPGEGEGGEGAPPGASGDADAACPHYYLVNFQRVVAAVLRSPDAELLNEEDGRCIGSFGRLSAPAQKLYVRLFQRKLNWLKVNRLHYAEVCLDLMPVIDELALAGLVQTGAELHDVSHGLDLLTAPELKLLARHFHLRAQGQRAEMIGALLSLAKQQSIFSVNRSPASAILTRIKEMVGPCVRLLMAARAVFSRVLLLYSLTEPMDVEDAACAGQNQLSTLLLVNMGRLTFPHYTIHREAKIFQNREDLLRYEAARHTLTELGVAMATKHWEVALQIYQTAKETWNHLDNSDLRFWRQLPVYLRCFTAGWVYTSIRCRGVEVLQRLHMYTEAVAELRDLLDQSDFCPGSRGHWWDRLSLNLQQHLRQPEQAVACVREALADARVHAGHRLALQQRAQRMHDSPSCKQWHHLLQELPIVPVDAVPHVTIKGRPCPGMGTARFLLEEEYVCAAVCSVEMLSLAHYRQLGFDQGIHGEGATYLTLFGLLFWEIIFLPGIPDVFRNPFQTHPLDLYTDCFYRNRSEPIESRLRLLQEASTDTLHTLMADVWNTHKDTATALVNWEIFRSIQQAQSLVSCLGGLFLSDICRILAEDPRQGRGGLPDLVVWNSERLQYKLVEVKGPSDQLSPKQRVWLHRLQKLGAAVEVCHVSVVGTRSLELG